MLKTPINKKNGSAKAMRSASEVSQFDQYGFGEKAEGGRGPLTGCPSRHWRGWLHSDERLI